MTMHCSARAVGHAGAGGTHQEAGSTTPARVTAIRAAHRLLKGSVGRQCDAITPAVGTSKAAPPPFNGWLSDALHCCCSLVLGSAG